MIFFENRRVYFFGGQQVAGPSESGASSLANSSSAPKTAAELKQEINEANKKGEKEKSLALQSEYTQLLLSQKNSQNNLKIRVDTTQSSPSPQEIQVWEEHAPNSIGAQQRLYQLNPTKYAQYAPKAQNLTETRHSNPSVDPQIASWEKAAALGSVGARKALEDKGLLVPNTPQKTQEVQENNPVFEIQAPVERVKQPVGVKEKTAKNAKPVLKTVSKGGLKIEAREETVGTIETVLLKNNKLKDYLGTANGFRISSTNPQNIMLFSSSESAGFTITSQMYQGFTQEAVLKFLTDRNIPVKSV